MPEKPLSHVDSPRVASEVDFLRGLSQNPQQSAIDLLDRLGEKGTRRRERLQALAGPSVETPENLQAAQTALGLTNDAYLRYTLERMMHLGVQVPEIYADAQRYVTGSGELPWEWYGTENDELDTIKLKYGVIPSRRRPRYPEEISPVTEIFYQSAETALDERMILRNPTQAGRYSELFRGMWVEDDGTPKWKTTLLPPNLSQLIDNNPELQELLLLTNRAAAEARAMGQEERKTLTINYNQI